MAFPTALGIATRVVDFGVYYDLTGSALLSAPWQVTVTIDREIRWVATGDVIEQIAVAARPDSTTGHAQIRMPCVDQAGWVDGNGIAVTGWSYTATWVATGFAKRSKTFQVFLADPDPLDGDKFGDGSTPPPSGGGLTYVNSVTEDGVLQTGNVVLTSGSGLAPDPVYAGLYSPGAGGSGGGGSGGPITVSQITDAGVVGGNLVRSADQNAALTVLGINGLSASVASKAADSAVVHNTGTETIAGAKTFTSPTVVGTPTASGHATTKAYVDAIGGSFAPITSPTFLGTPTVPNVTAGDSSTKAANTAFVGGALTTAAGALTPVILLIPLVAAPIAGDGQNGDYAINLLTGLVYGPKAAGAWPGTAINSFEGPAQTFAASGTYTLPLWANTHEVLCIGPGGGAGAGARVPSGTAGAGGGGGGGGGFSRYVFRSSDLTSTVAVTVTAGGAGGAAQTTNGTAGANASGSGYSDTSFGAFLRARAGQPGNGGGLAASGAGGAGGLGQSGGGAGAASASGGTVGSTAATASGGTGGGSGGGITTGAVASAGGFGTAPNPWAGNSVAVQGAAGTSGAGGAGGVGLTYAAGGIGCSGAGGGSATLGAGGAGGDGAIGSGGGGGGASLNGFASGPGGNGGAGLCIVVPRA